MAYSRISILFLLLFRIFPVIKGDQGSEVEGGIEQTLLQNETIMSIERSSNNKMDQDYYDDVLKNETTAISFDSYEITTVNPGKELLLFTLGLSYFSFIIGYFVYHICCQKSEKSKRNDENRDDDDSVPSVRGDDESTQENDDVSMSTTSSVYLKEFDLGKEYDSNSCFGDDFEDNPQSTVEDTVANKHSTTNNENQIEYDLGENYDSNSGVGDGFEDNPQSTKEDTDINKRAWKETRKIIGLGTPWMLQSIITDGSSFATVAFISHYLGLREMICYSNVWFIIYTVYLINDVWFDTVYKHVNVSAATRTEEGYRIGGLYIKIGVIGNFIIALPLSIVSVVLMPTILRWIGYDESITEISLSYAAVAAANNLFDSTTGLIDSVLDIEGHAKFTAAFELWETILLTPLEFLFVRYHRPTLLEIGLFHFAEDVLSSLIYFLFTGYYKKWFKCYGEGFRAPVNCAIVPQVKKLIKMTLPLTFEAFMGNAEYTILTIFAAHQGTAEAASWVLLSYVWDVVGIAPGSFGAASSCQVAKLLGQNDGFLAKRVAWQSIRIGVSISLFCAALLLFLRKQFVWCLSVDPTIEKMLYELIPYISICQPVFSISWTAMELNDALHLFKRAMISNAFATSFIIIPLGYVMTYIFHFNLEGLVSAQCIGYTIGGVANLIFFAGADWDKAVRKAQEISDVVKEGIETETDRTGHYDDCYWDDMPIEARNAAETLGYNQQNWDNSSTDTITEHANFTEEQVEAAKVLGYDTNTYDIELCGTSSLSFDDGDSEPEDD